MSIADNVAQVHRRIAAAANRAGRDAAEISLLVVTKKVSPDRIREAYHAGLRLFGENRVQEFSSKADLLSDLTEAQWHLIGHLQTNKVGKALELFYAFDSVDSLRLAEKLNASAANMGKQVPVLIEINIGGEAAKSGVAPDSPELEQLLGALSRLRNLHIQGLMTVPPFADDPQASRPYFRKLRELRDRITSRDMPIADILSMGMSHDFEVAIEEGSTCVRIGTAIFGERRPA